MNAVRTIPITTPDGVLREARLVAGAVKRVCERFGHSDFQRIAAEKGQWIYVEILYYLLYDHRGNPPAGLDLDWLMENSSPSFVVEAMATIVDAWTEGASSKNAVEALYNGMRKEALSQLTGSLSKLLPHSASDSRATNSGGESLSSNSMLTPNTGDHEKTTPTTAPE